jgi:hypothetical protein
LPQKFLLSPAFPGEFSISRDRINGSDEFPMNAAKKLEHVSLDGTRSRLSGFRYDDSSTPAEAKTVATAAPLVPSQTREDRFSDGEYLVSMPRVQPRYHSA